jgi:hypothetical protein
LGTSIAVKPAAGRLSGRSICAVLFSINPRDLGFHRGLAECTGGSALRDAIEKEPVLRCATLSATD